MTKRIPLTTRTKALNCAFLLVLISALVHGQTILRDPPPYQLTEMKIVPFSQRTNSFLAEIKNDAAFSGWNDLNLSLFVTIEVSGKAGSYGSRRNVEVVAYEGRRLIVKRVGHIGVLDESTGKYFVPVWLYGSFCQPVTIKARLIGQTRSATLQRKIDFQCGE